jgi:hypothetical protein
MKKKGEKEKKRKKRKKLQDINFTPYDEDIVIISTSPQKYGKQKRRLKKKQKEKEKDEDNNNNNNSSEERQGNGHVLNSPKNEKGRNLRNGFMSARFEKNMDEKNEDFENYFGLTQKTENKYFSSFDDDQ